MGTRIVHWYERCGDEHGQRAFFCMSWTFDSRLTGLGGTGSERIQPLGPQRRELGGHIGDAAQHLVRAVPAVGAVAVCLRLLSTDHGCVGEPWTTQASP